ncbi:hypothetical protein PAGA_a3090 [Pseudoalteromonas agarivorans DSM 14585]|uniref:Uncharacterized protein n=1 Tax=Pseudoalteromonas agarivorans DSM 14585 TaxID=1312369 RepID=A0ACA8DZ82_9GAMM|nr:hypothetical protein PAGA_a3090 [Pseudoalteromonas agarivorans DSM 14585]
MQSIRIYQQITSQIGTAKNQIFINKYQKLIFLKSGKVFL